MLPSYVSHATEAVETWQERVVVAFDVVANK